LDDRAAFLPGPRDRRQRERGGTPATGTRD